MRFPTLPLPASGPRVRIGGLATLALAALLFARVATQRSTAGSTASPLVSPTAPPATSSASDSRAGIVAEGSTPATMPALDKSEASVATQLPDAAAAAEGTTSMVIRTGTATVQVDSLEPAMTSVRALAARLGGFVANTTLTAGRDQVRSATLEVKVPAARFDELVSAMSPLGRVETVNVTAEDVGEEFVDVAAREANARRLEERLVTLLATNTGKLTDVLTVERELARVREEIERYDGRMRWLKAHAAVSTLAVSVHEPPPIIGPTPEASPIADAFRQAWRNFVGLVASVIASSGIYVPLGLLALLAWYVLWPRRRRA